MAPAIGPGGRVFNFTSGWIDTHGTFAQLGGLFEVRAQLPAQNASGAWPAFWTLPANASACVACPAGVWCAAGATNQSVPCPAGYYCADVANTKPLPCYPGTYNPLRQQSNCTLCPPGHVCPRWGMLEPELCPAGFICSEFGLSQPVVMCPPGFFCPAGTITDDLASSVPFDPMAAPYIGDFIQGYRRLLVGSAAGEGAAAHEEAGDDPAAAGEGEAMTTAASSRRRCRGTRRPAKPASQPADVSPRTPAPIHQHASC